MVIYATLALCAFLAYLLVSRYDLYDKEPWPLIVLTVAAGAGVMWLMGPAEEFTLARVFGDTWTPARIAVVAATHEELARVLLVALIALLLPRFFNDPMDGIIYGSMTGLGMALEESHFFLRLVPPEGAVLPPTELVRLFGHLVLGGISGFAVGMLRMRMRGGVRALLGCVAASMSIHFAWDWIAFSVKPAGVMRWWQTAGAVALMLSGILLYGMLVVVGSDWSRQVFAPRRRRQIWGWPFTLLVQRARPARSEASSDKSR